MKANSFKYLVKEGVRNVWVNRLMSVASVGVLTTCLLLIGFAFLITTNINSMVDYIGDQNEIVFFIKEDAAEEEINAALNELKQDERLFDVVYIDREQALEEFKLTMDEDAAALLDGLEGEENPCLASFRFKISDLSQTSLIVSELETSSLKEKINAPTDVADTMTNIKDMINVFGVVLISVLIVVSLVIISNTIRATVTARHREIRIMRYVGATGNFIRLPFFVEGILIGLFSATLAFLLVWGLYAIVFSYATGQTSVWLQDLFAGSIVPFETVAWPLLGGFLAGGAVVGSLGCLFSIRTHLKV